ncbi:MAG: Holliday junction branch migration protein RuvA [Planctomycetes bacterium]|nr:Holliday junction branch migration protein RuvA [Planctomycetota bacterium]
MFEFIRGQVVSKAPTHVIVEAGGIGYRLFIPVSTYERLPEKGEVSLLVHLYVREDQMKLYGFATADERDLFELLTSVPGVGPSIALLALSSGSVGAIKGAIRDGNSDYLQKIRGIGKKMAQRIVLELKGYLEETFVAAAAQEPGRGTFNDAVLALVKLGYMRRSAEQAVRKAEVKLAGETSVESLVKESFKHL